MSAHFAIPATTFVLQGVIERALAKVYGAGQTAPPVTIAPPPRGDRAAGPANGGASADGEATGVILYLYHVAPNPGWRNVYAPVIDSSGARVGPSPLVLDLHYLLAATGSGLEREAVLGVALHALLRLGIIPRDLIKQILSDVVVPSDPTPLITKLTTEHLWEQYEQITLAPQALDADMLSRLWTALLSPFRPSVGLLATTVFLDTDEQFPDGPAVKTVTLAARPNLDSDTDMTAADFPLAFAGDAE